MLKTLQTFLCSRCCKCHTVVDLLDWSWTCPRLNLSVAHHGVHMLYGMELAMDAFADCHGVVARGYLGLHRRRRFACRCDPPCTI